jgi:hypothetical protein
VTLGTPSMRPAPFAAGFKFPRPGNVSSVAKSGASAEAKRENESAMPLDVSNFTKSRREVFTSAPLAPGVGFALYLAASLLGLLVGCFDGKYFRREVRAIV